jgi:serine protease Do
MKKQVLLSMFLALAIIAAACGKKEPAGPPEVAEATFARGLSEQMEPVNPGNEFDPDQTVYLSVKLKGNPQEGVVSARFFFKDEEITRTSLDLAQMRKEGGLVFVLGGNTLVGFTLTHDQPFPAGEEYEARLFINDEPAGTYRFKVTGPDVAAVPPTKAAEATKAADATKEPEPTPTPAQQPEPVQSGAVSSLEDVKSAVIQIEAAGSFIHPEFGEVYNAAGRGSGFIIDPSGIAVTNNHVATGAALLRVWVGGESEPRNAKILGVSECSDLAVIDIEGDGYPYLEWYKDEIKTGLSIYAAGFPLGDPEYTLLQGIVSKERAGGETNWASVDYVIEHTALTNPGNSGGPVVTQDGKVVGVHYAGNADTEQHFAIARPEALPVIEQLREGTDVNSIGVNGQAVVGENLSGIWVSSVESGSPADRAGVQGGDIIVRLEGLVLSTDGTMADYCDILRTHNRDDTLSLEVLRFATQELLEGQLNGRELTQKMSFAQQVESSGGGEGSDVGAGTAYSSYITVNDDSGALVMSIPAEWSDFNGAAWAIDDQVVGGAIRASGSLDNFYNTWTEPGVFFGASRVLAQTMNEQSILDLDIYDFSGDCEYLGRDTYEDAVYTGLYDYYTNCGGVGTEFVNLTAVPANRAFVILLQVQVVSQADLEAVDKILNSFEVIGTLPSQ